MKTKKIISIILCISLLMTYCVGTAYAETNTIQSMENTAPVQIYEAEDLACLEEGIQYYLMNDIELSMSDIEALKTNLNGRDLFITQYQNAASSDGMVYDADNDTIYIHNLYQLMLAGKDDEPVLSMDYDPETIGMGQVFPSEDGVITYSDEHNYVLSSDFTTDTPEPKVNTIVDDENSSPDDINQGENNEDGSEDNALGENGEGEQKNSDIEDEGSTEDSKDEIEENKEDPSENEKAEEAVQIKKGAKNTRAISSPHPIETNGRQYFGEVVREIDGKNYILIGCQQQLRAIGSGKDVTEPIWEVFWKKINTGTFTSEWVIIDDDPDHPSGLYYPGDADLIKFDSTFDWSDKDLYDIDNGPHRIGEDDYLDGLIAVGSTMCYSYYGSKLENNDITYDQNAKIKKVNIGNSAKYTYDANYIVFRDIFLTEDGTDDTDTVEWDPIDTFTGYMEGRLDMEEGENPTIHHVEITQDTAIDQNAYSANATHAEYGVGFFRSLTTPYDNVLSVRTDPITVKNINLDDVTVETTTTDISRNFSLINALLTPLLNLLNMSSGLEADPKSLSTGAFVGSVRGNVKITDCHITDLHKVDNANNWTGGFVGCTTGITRYEALSGILGALTETLQAVLNIVPVLGLGDLIGVLTNGGALDVKKLLPVGYTNSVMENDSVSYSNGGYVSGSNYSGGFAGESTGAVFKNCNIEKNYDLSVSGTDYTGGFVGNANNIVIAGLLTELGVDVIGNFPVNTTMLDCDITGAGNLDVMTSGRSEDKGFAGGFAGNMANSYAVDCSIEGLRNVSGGDYVGGFTGLATTGELVQTNTNEGLVSVVSGLLTGILNGDYNAQLLNLVGLRPSVIAGCDISGDNITITADGSYAGGIAGYAGALQISNTADLNDSSKLTSQEVTRVINANSLNYSFNSNRNSITSNSLSVTSDSCAGGAIGCGNMTGVAGVLDGTASAANYIRFELKETDINGTNVNITSDNAGGIIGKGIGGEILDVHLTGLNTVSGVTNAGGFGGSFGSGTLANVGGVNLLGLNVVQIDSIASVGGMIETYVKDSDTTGISSGAIITSTAEGGTSGGFIGLCISGKTINCGAYNIYSVSANTTEGFAGGFIGKAKAGDAVSTIGESLGDNDTLTGLQIQNLLGIMSALTPEFHDSTLTFVENEGDQILGDFAGGFVGDGESIDVNYSVNHDPDGGEEANTQITGLCKVHGFSYAGGFAGRLEPGDVAQTGSVKLLGLLNVTELLKVMDVAYPCVSRSNITGGPLTVIAEGKDGNIDIGDAGGFIGNGKAVIVEHSNVSEIASVDGTFHAGGYIGYMRSGSAAEAGDATGALLNSVLGRILNINQLASVLQMASSKITDSKVTGIENGFTVKCEPRPGNDSTSAQGYAGGYVGEMQSGLVDNFQNASSGGKGTASENLKSVEGHRYAGGFGGKVASGAVAEFASNTSVLTSVVEATNLLSLVNAFRPEIKDASVLSAGKGLYVHVTGTDEADRTNDPQTGSAGGYIGYGSGLVVERSDVNKIKHTDVTEPENLQSVNGESYFGNGSSYAIKAYKYSGGFFGKLDIGSTAAVGGVGLLDKLASLSSIASALDVVLSEAKDCDTFGAAGGFNVLATNGNALKGYAGGFVGNILGSQLRDCNSYNFAHIIGRVSAGGYAGTIEPGNVADAVEDLNVLGGLISASNLLSVLRSFVPEIINSETTCIPCGGAVRADAASSNGIQRGTAGGYAGYNLGGQIWGNKSEEPDPKECAAIRIRSVYGIEFAGGYTGLLKCANVADTGNLSALYGLINLSNPLSLLQAVYATEENTAVYGPLNQMDITTWNKWVNAVAKYGPYGEELQALGEVTSNEQLLTLIRKYAYGYQVTASRSAVATNALEGSAAGGYVGRMEGGTITNGNGYDMMSVDAYRASGGFAGEMITGSVANVGDINLLGLDIIGNLPVLQTFVPVIKTSSVAGYQSGATVKAIGSDNDDIVGIAGGYVGDMQGGQIWGNSDTRCKVTNLRSIQGTSYVGGFVGRAIPGSAATLNTNSQSGLLNKLLQALIGTPGDLAKVLNATVATIRYADTESWNEEYGIIINGTYAGNDGLEYANAAGGFAGTLTGTVIGKEKEPNSGFNVKGIRKIIAGEYAGGAVGLADVGSVAEVSAGNTSILDLIKAGSVDLADSFKTIIYHSQVNGCEDTGMYVSAREQQRFGTGVSTVYSGNAGGFIGALLQGTAKNCSAKGIALIEAPNYAGGFIGYMGKSGLVDVDKVNVIGDNESYNLLGGSLGVLDVFGSHAENCEARGIPSGFGVRTLSGNDQIAGGFTGFGDLARIKECDVYDLKKVETGAPQRSAQAGTAGGFIGKTSYAYLADLQFDSTLLQFLMQAVLNPLVRALYLDADGLAALNLVELDLGFIKVGILHDGDTLSLNLLGLPISVALSKASSTDPGATDLAVIRIGDSVVKLPCTEDGLTNPESLEENLRISLIKANRTKVVESTVNGIDDGYNVYGNEVAGGFVGYNNEGVFEEDDMYRCDVIEGNSVGPFSGSSSLVSVYSFNTLSRIEGEDNNYRVYRVTNTSPGSILKSNGDTISNKHTTEDPYDVYEVAHMHDISQYDEFQGATIEGGPLDVYVTASKAVLMDDKEKTLTVPDSEMPAPDKIQDVCDTKINYTIDKIWHDFYDTHPGEIHVSLMRTYTEDGDEVTETVPGYEDIVIEGSNTEMTWQYIIEGLPVYKTEEVPYTYFALESVPVGYSAETVHEAFHTTITNSVYVPPPTGVGEVTIDWNLVIFAVASAFLALLIRKRRRERKA